MHTYQANLPVARPHHQGQVPGPTPGTRVDRLLHSQSTVEERYQHTQAYGSDNQYLLDKCTVTRGAVRVGNLAFQLVHSLCILHSGKLTMSGRISAWHYVRVVSIFQIEGVLSKAPHDSTT